MLSGTDREIVRSEIARDSRSVEVGIVLGGGGLVLRFQPTGQEVVVYTLDEWHDYQRQASQEA